MPTKARPMTREEEYALDQLGQAHEEGRAIPAPEMVLFSGETALKVRDLSELLEVDPQEVIGIALQQLYERVQARIRAEEEGPPETEETVQGVPQPPEGADPFRPY